MLGNLSKIINLKHLDPTLIKGYVSSHDGREVTFRLDEVEQTLKYYKKLEDDYSKKAEQLIEEECQLLVLDDLPNLARTRHLLNPGDELTLDEELREYLGLTSLDLCTKVKVVTGTKYVFGEKHYLVKLGN